MTQVTDYSIPGSPLSMASLATTLENCFAASASQNRGATAPSNPFEGMHWWDTALNPVEVLKRYTVTAGWVSLLAVNITTGEYYVTTSLDTYFVAAADVAGSASAVTLAVDGFTAYAAGQRFTWVAEADSTGAMTLNVESVGAKTCVKYDSAAIASGDVQSGDIVTAIYDGTNMQLFLPYRSPPTLSSLGGAALSSAQTFSGAQKVSRTTLTSSAASIAVDFSLNNEFEHTFTENTTLANPSNIVAGQSGRIYFTQHASSPKTLAFGSQWDFINGTTPTVAATNSARNTLHYTVRSATQIEAVLTGAWS